MFTGSNQLDPENETLLANNWLDNSKGYPYQYSTSAKHCIPISESYYYALRGPQGGRCNFKEVPNLTNATTGFLS